MGKDCKKIIAYLKMSTVFSKIVRKQCLHAYNFFHVFSMYEVDIKNEDDLMIWRQTLNESNLNT